MSDKQRCVDPPKSNLPEPTAVIIQEKDRLIRTQTKRIEGLEREVTQLKRERDRLNTKLALLAGRIPVQDHHEPNFDGIRANAFSQVKNSTAKDSVAVSAEMNSSCDNALSLIPPLECPSFHLHGFYDFVKCNTSQIKLKHFDSTQCKTRSNNVERYHTAARVIQHTYRRYWMKKNFERLRSDTERSKRINERNERSQVEAIVAESSRTGSGKSCDVDLGVMSHPRSGNLRTIDEHYAENLRVESNISNSQGQVLYPDLSDSSDNESVLDAVLEPAFDESSTNFEHLLEAEEVDGADDSFNSEDSQDGEAAFSSQCSTLRANNFNRFPHQWTAAEPYESTNDDDSRFTTLRSQMSDVVFSDSDSVTGDALSTPTQPEDAVSFESSSLDSSSQASSDSLMKLGAGGVGNFDAFVRFCAPSYSPIWKRKSRNRGSTSSLPDASSTRSSQLSSAGSLGTSELTGSFADISQESDEPSSCLVPDDAGITDNHDGTNCSRIFNHPSPLYRGRSEPFRGLQLEMPASHPVPLFGTFCDAGACVQSDRLRKRIYRIGLNLFNRKPERGIRYLIENKFIDLRPNAVAKFLISRKGLSRQMIGEYLGTIQKQFNIDVLRCFADEIDLAGLQVDVALRKYQSFFRMPGEAQKIERLMEVFAQRYCACNPDQVENFRTPDTVFLLAFAIIMLNTDQHNRCIKDERRMTMKDFINNLRGIDDGYDIDNDLLAGIFERMHSSEFKTASDHVTQVAKVEEMISGKKPLLQPLVAQHRRLVCYCHLYEVPDLTKHEKLGSHQRELFLFNDMLVVTKMISRKKKGVSYCFRQSFPLLGMAVYLFETMYYKYGVRLTHAARAKELITLCAQTEHDRIKFVEDLKEAILEVEEMKVLETYENRKDHSYPGNNISYHGRQNCQELNRHSKDSGVVDIDHLSHHRLSASDCEERKNSFSSSVYNFSECQRTESRGSLDSGMASTGSSSASSCMEPAKLGHSRSLRTHPSSAPSGSTRDNAFRKNKNSN